MQPAITDLSPCYKPILHIQDKSALRIAIQYSNGPGMGDQTSLDLIQYVLCCFISKWIEHEENRSLLRIKTGHVQVKNFYLGITELQLTKFHKIRACNIDERLVQFYSNDFLQSASSYGKDHPSLAATEIH